MVLLLLLGACICVGLSDDTRTVAQLYGDRYSLKLVRNAETLEFTPLHGPYQRVILWKQDDPGVSEASRGQVAGNLWVMDELTQEDSGQYTVRGKDKRTLYTKTILVSEHTEYYEIMVGEPLNFSFKLAPAQCDLTFFPDVDSESYKLVKEGSIVDNVFDGRIQLLHSSRFRFLIERIQTWDSGRFELTDEKGNLALVVQLKVLVPTPLSLYICYAVGAVFVVCLCRSCVKSCCGASSSKTDHSGSATAATPNVFNHEDITQPTGPRYQSNQSSGTTNPCQPSGTSIGPLVAATGEQGAAPPVSHGTDRSASDPEPRFELKGLNFPCAPPLSSDSTHCDVYTSDKLNFF